MLVLVVVVEVEVDVVLPLSDRRGGVVVVNRDRAGQVQAVNGRRLGGWIRRKRVLRQDRQRRGDIGSAMRTGCQGRWAEVDVDVAVAVAVGVGAGSVEELPFPSPCKLTPGGREGWSYCRLPGPSAVAL